MRRGRPGQIRVGLTGSRTRVLGMYRFDNEKNPVASQGLNLRLKLPTGDYRVSNADGAVAERRAAAPGPEAPTSCWRLLLRAGHSPRFELVRPGALSAGREHEGGIQTGANQLQLNVGLSLSPRP